MDDAAPQTTGDDQPSGRDIAFHPFQLSNVWANRSHAERRGIRAGDPQVPSFESAVRRIRTYKGPQGFSCEFSIAVQIPVLDDELFVARLVLIAHFAAGEPVRATDARQFARTQAVYLLWPFARSYIDLLAMMSGVHIPPLPLLLVG